MILADSPQTRQCAADVIATGGVLGFRTDTFYGLGADPFDPKALIKLKALKGSEASKPILVVLSDLDQANRLTETASVLFDDLRRLFWPGPLTIVVKAPDAVPAELTGSSGTVGIRLPLDEEVQEFIRVCGGILTATSANLAGEPPARTANDVEEYFGDALSMVVNSGPAKAERPSTVLDISQAVPRLLREGVISRAELERALPGLQ
jgi:L-threonylcarbamoyladenylate synthase